MAEDGTPGDRRDDVVNRGQGQRRREQPDRVVSPQPAECRPLCPWVDEGRQVPHWVGERGEGESANLVPARDIESIDAETEGRQHELHRRACNCDHHHSIDDQRELRPLQGLQDAGRDQCPARQDDPQVPDEEHEPAQTPAGDRQTDEPWGGVITKGQEGIPQETEEDPLRVIHPQAPPAQGGVLAEEFRGGELGGHQQPEDRGDEQATQRGERMGAHQSVLHRRERSADLEVALVSSRVRHGRSPR